MAHLTRGALAKKTGVNLGTIRYYEQRGLLPEPPRSKANYRLYPGDAVLRVRFIRKAQELGFTLREIKELLSLRAAPGTRCGDVRRRAEAKVRDMGDRIRTLKAMQRALGKLVAECSGRGPVTECPILESMDSEDLP